MRRTILLFTLAFMVLIMTLSSQATETPSYEAHIVDGAFELRSYV